MRPRPPALLAFARRIRFLLVSTVIMVFFSEKAYWYVQGYVLLDLLLIYAFPTFVFLWLLEAFEIHKPAPLFLAGAMYGLLVEGVFTTVIYEGGLLDPIMVSYPSIAWHGALSVFFGWYFLRRQFLASTRRSILAWCVVFGLFWGLWSLVFRTNPEGGGILGDWSILAYAAYAFTFGGLLTLAHALLGQGVWQPVFRPTRWEKGAVVLFLTGYFFIGPVLQVPFALIKLPLLLGLILLVLWLARRHQDPAPTILAQLDGRVPWRKAALLLAMPATATAVYALTSAIPLPDEFIRTVIYEGFASLQGILGGIVFLIALFFSLKTRGQNKPPYPARQTSAPSSRTSGPG